MSPPITSLRKGVRIPWAVNPLALEDNCVFSLTKIKPSLKMGGFFLLYKDEP